MFYGYWIITMISIISSFIYLTFAKSKHRTSIYITSIIQTGLSVILPVLNLISILKYDISCSYETYFVSMIINTRKMEMILIIHDIGYIIMILFIFINGYYLYVKKDYSYNCE